MPLRLPRCLSAGLCQFTTSLRIHPILNHLMVSGVGMLLRMDDPMRSGSLRLRRLKQRARRPAIIGMMVVYLIVGVTLVAKFFRAHLAQHISDWTPQPLTINPTRIRSGATKVQRETTILVGEPEVWARGPAQMSSAVVVLRDLLDADVTKQLRSLCGRCLYRTLTSYVRAQDHGQFTVVLTGDIPAVWLRDSAVQMATYIPRMARHPAMRQTLEGAIRAQAYFILQVHCYNMIAFAAKKGRVHLIHPPSILSGKNRTHGPTPITPNTCLRTRCPRMIACSVGADGSLPEILSWTASRTSSISCGTSTRPLTSGRPRPCLPSRSFMTQS